MVDSMKSSSLEYWFAWIFLLPVFFLVFSGGNIQLLPYAYALVSIYFFAMLSRDLLISNQVRKNMIWPGALIGILFLGAFASIGISANHISLPSFSDSILRLGLFCLFLLAWSRFLHSGLSSLAGAFIFPSTICLAGIFMQMQLFPQVVYGRHTFLGAQPNLGGEVIVFLLFSILFSSRTLFRFACVGVCLYLLFLLQSRAALIAAVLLFLAAETLLHRRFPKSVSIPKLVIFLGFLAFFIAAAVLLFPGPMLALLQWIADRVLFLNDSYRGLGTGLVGRLGTYEYLADVFSEAPLIGAGYDQLRWQGFSAEQSGVHNGFAVLLGELGIFGAAIIGMMIYRLITDRHDRFLLVARIAFGLMFFLSARSVNLGVFPMIFWALLLPWPTTKARLDAVNDHELLKQTARLPTRAQ